MPVEARIETPRNQLLERGRLLVQSGTVRSSAWTLALHSDYGSPRQDKPQNQDYALLWMAAVEPANPAISWAAALADGVTCSYRPEWGARLVCHHALARLLAEYSTASPLERAIGAINAAGEALGELAEEIAEDEGSYRPAHEFAATWRYRLQRGQLLQTTLTLAWLEGQSLCLALVGDGGGAWRRTVGSEVEETLLGAGEPESNRVHALGPANRRVAAPDLWRELPVGPEAMLALYTDGIRRAVGASAGAMLDRLAESLTARPEENAAEIVVRQFATSGDEALEDNLTLLVAKRR